MYLFLKYNLLLRKRDTEIVNSHVARSDGLRKFVTTGGGFSCGPSENHEEYDPGDYEKANGFTGSGFHFRDR